MDENNVLNENTKQINDTQQSNDKKNKLFIIASWIIIGAIVISILFSLFSSFTKIGNKSFTLGAYEYEVPKSWKTTRDGSSVYYHYTSSNDMLMTSTEVMTLQLDETEYEKVLYSLGINKEISRSDISHDRIIGFMSEIEGSTSMEDYSGYIAILQKSNNIITLCFGDFEERGNYKDEFLKIVNSVKCE